MQTDSQTIGMTNDPWSMLEELCDRNDVASQNLMLAASSSNCCAIFALFPAFLPEDLLRHSTKYSRSITQTEQMNSSVTTKVAAAVLPKVTYRSRPKAGQVISKIRSLRGTIQYCTLPHSSTHSLSAPKNTNSIIPSSSFPHLFSSFSTSTSIPPPNQPAILFNSSN